MSLNTNFLSNYLVNISSCVISSALRIYYTVAFAQVNRNSSDSWITCEYLRPAHPYLFDTTHATQISSAPTVSGSSWKPISPSLPPVCPLSAPSSKAAPSEPQVAPTTLTRTATRIAFARPVRAAAREAAQGPPSSRASLGTLGWRCGTCLATPPSPTARTAATTRITISFLASWSSAHLGRRSSRSDDCGTGRVSFAIEKMFASWERPYDVL